VTAPIWIVGGSGLLGAGVTRALEGQAWQIWQPSAAIPWADPAARPRCLAAAVAEFAALVARTRPRSWTICWCAGAAVVGTSAEGLAEETDTFRQFLALLGEARPLPAVSGRLFLASSAGGIYAGRPEARISERLPPRPLSPYGQTKLAQEQALAAWAGARPGISTLVGRFANLYGPGQHLDKPQGLISHMSRCLIYGRPVHVYVSLDTIRDYLFADDAGRLVVDGLGRLEREASGAARHVVKIFGSEREISVAGIVGLFRRLAKRQLRIVFGILPVGHHQPLRLQFRSEVWPDQRGVSRVDLFEGIGRVYHQQLQLFQAGRLKPPPLTGAAR
jgi:UDP-glucose 4-epimerase